MGLNFSHTVSLGDYFGASSFWLFWFFVFTITVFWLDQILVCRRVFCNIVSFAFNFLYEGSKSNSCFCSTSLSPLSASFSALLPTSCTFDAFAGQASGENCSPKIPLAFLFSFFFLGSSGENIGDLFVFLRLIWNRVLV